MVNKLPQGCDQQGRHPEAAEAATDLGIEEPEDDSLRVVIDDVLLALAGIAAICVVVLTAAGLV
jgi:hypothetical protein